MTSAELKEIVEQRTSDASVLGRIAGNLKNDGGVQQIHADQRQFAVQWQDLGGYWRCTIASPGDREFLARIDLLENATVRVEAREPCSVTVSPQDDLLYLIRYR